MIVEFRKRQEPSDYRRLYSGCAYAASSSLYSLRWTSYFRVHSIGVIDCDFTLQ